MGDANTFFKDREGDIWVGSGDGIDVFVPTRLRIVRPVPGAFALARARDGSMWWSEADYNAGRWGIDHFSGDRVVEEASVADPISCGYADENGTLWFAGQTRSGISMGSSCNLCRR